MGNSTRRPEIQHEVDGQSSYRERSQASDDSDERMRREYVPPASRRRSVSFEIRSIRRQSSMIHENLVHINMRRNVREVYSGLDDSHNNVGEGSWGTVRVVTRR